MSKVLLLTTTVLALSLGACSFKKSSDDGKSAAAAPTAPADEDKLLEQKQLTDTEQATITADDVKVSFTETETPNSYVMKISWPDRAKHVTLQFKTNAFNAQFDQPRYYNYLSSYENHCHGGDQFDLQIITFDSHNQIVSTILKENLSVPKDVVFDQNVRLDDNTNIQANRVFFTVNGAIDTNGFAFTLTANTLIAPQQPTKDRYQIVTLDKNADSFREERFKKGSNIFINIKKATGYLSVNLLGADGSNGRSGNELEPAGANAAPASYTGARGQDAILSSPKFHGRDSDGSGQPYCSRAATNGGDGRVGDPGANGEAGGDGGSTGNLIFIAQENGDFHLLVTALRSVGGVGGPGAAGHQGGAGGPAGNPIDTAYCRPARNGNNGPQGPQGNTGANGAAGLLGDIQCSSLKDCEVQKL